MTRTQWAEAIDTVADGGTHAGNPRCAPVYDPQMGATGKPDVFYCEVRMRERPLNSMSLSTMAKMRKVKHWASGPAQKAAMRDGAGTE
jgi:hypothetical protein